MNRSRQRPHAALAGALAALAALAAAVLALGAVAEEPREVLSPTEGYGLARDLLADRQALRRHAVGRLIEARDPTLVPAIVDALFFVQRNDRGPVLSVLEAITGERRGSRYLDWVEYVGSRTDIEPKEGYAAWKGSMLERIDPRFGRLVHARVATRIRLEEVVWGGVRLEGIPALDRPRHVAAEEAGYLDPAEQVFGVSLGGEHRAYPRRILSWHEMANDVVGAAPVTLSYCTLCGSAVLYSGRLPSGRVLTFGTSGLLYRSNKLMVDRDTGSLFSNLTGEAVVGPLSDPDSAGPVVLETLPVTLTTWGEWRARHPGTTVLALEAERGRRWGFDYRPGAADRARQGVAFPVWKQSARLDPKTEIYALRVAGIPKAYPLDRLAERGLVHDTVGGVGIVLVADADSGAVRAYESRGHRFERGAEAALLDADGRGWTLTEEALVPPADADLEPLPRVAGHVAFWFGWFGFYPDTEVFDP